MYTPSGWPAVSTPVLPKPKIKHKPKRAGSQVYTPSGWPAVSTPVLRALAGKPGAAKKALAELDGADLALPEGGVRSPITTPAPRLPAHIGRSLPAVD